MRKYKLGDIATVEISGVDKKIKVIYQARAYTLRACFSL